MNFVSFFFILFLLFSLLGFYGIPAKWRMFFLLAMSYLFYASWSIPFIAVLVFSTSVDYWMSRIITHNPTRTIRQGALISGIIINLSILIFFKYYNFLTQSTHGLIHWLGLSSQSLPLLDIVLPLGISFYTFEAISYLVDVYRGKSPAKNWLEYNFYILYFPHLISGPIIRFCELMPQYRDALKLPPLKRVASGCELILLGYLFKVFIADNAAMLADPVFNTANSLSVLQKDLGILAFTVQIYYDFMGYTHIARGVSLLFNIELPVNFNYPYLATNISNFWERWHISLSRWIRDYLYFPLGGSKGTLGQTSFNLMLTMSICGAWHGAAWTFILWGSYHGLLLTLYHWFKYFKTQFSGLFVASREEQNWYRVVSILFTFFLVTVGWILFRAPDFETFQALLLSFVDIPGFLHAVSQEVTLGRYGDLGVWGILVGLCFIGPWITRIFKVCYQEQPFWVRVQVACMLVVICWILTAEGSVPFIYFQF